MVNSVPLKGTKVRLVKDFYTTPLKDRPRTLSKDYICKIKDEMQTVPSIIEILSQSFLCANYGSKLVDGVR